MDFFIPFNLEAYHEPNPTGPRHLEKLRSRPNVAAAIQRVLKVRSQVRTQLRPWGKFPEFWGSVFLEAKKLAKNDHLFGVSQRYGGVGLVAWKKWVNMQKSSIFPHLSGEGC